MAFIILMMIWVTATYMNEEDETFDLFSEYE